MVDFLTLSFTKALAKYYNINATWPGTVLVFRDGVGDGQLNSTKIEVCTVSFGPSCVANLIFQD